MESRMNNNMSFFEQIKNHRKLLNHHPKSWNIDESVTEIIEFRNSQHFKYAIGLIQQKNNMLLGVSYKEALHEMRQEKGLISEEEYETVEQFVKENLIAKNLITKDIYKGVTYSHEGENIDMLKFLEGDPDCYIVPKPREKIHFYELYIDSTVPHYVQEKDYMKNVAKLLATVKLLEQKQIFIKINLILRTKDSGDRCVKKKDLLVVVPLFSHRETKSINRISSIVNMRFLRKFGFAILETIFGEYLSSGHGRVNKLKQTIDLGNGFDEVKFAEEIVDKLITKCEME
jgi:hypothetical protein